MGYETVVMPTTDFDPRLEQPYLGPLHPPGVCKWRPSHNLNDHITNSIKINIGRYPTTPVVSEYCKFFRFEVLSFHDATTLTLLQGLALVKTDTNNNTATITSPVSPESMSIGIDGAVDLMGRQPAVWL